MNERECGNLRVRVRTALDTRCQPGGIKLFDIFYLMLKGTLILYGLFLAAAVIGGLAKLWLSGNARCLNSNCRF